MKLDAFLDALVAGHGLLQAKTTPVRDPLVTELPGGMAYATPSPANEDQMRLEQAQVNSMAQHAYAVASGNVYAHSNFDQRLAFSQDLHRSNLPCTPVMTRTYQGSVPPNNLPYQLRG